MIPGFKILIVDDEEQSRSLIRKLLQDVTGEENILEAARVAEAVEKIKTNQPSWIFLDVQLNHETGFDLLDQLGRDNTQVIFITAYSEFAVKAFRYSAVDYLLKPLDKEEFDE